MTTAPAFTAMGANSLEMLPPANRAMSMPLKESSFASCTVYVLPFTVSWVPALRAEASNRNSAKGKSRSSISFKNSVPTAPVAPKMATLWHLKWLRCTFS